VQNADVAGKADFANDKNDKTEVICVLFTANKKRPDCGVRGLSVRMQDMLAVVHRPEVAHGPRFQVMGSVND